MTTIPSAKNQDPTLFHVFIGGPIDGRKSGDMPVNLSGEKLTGAIMKLPLSVPAHYSLYSVYECQSETQVNGFWEFYFIRMEGPNGEILLAGEDMDELREELGIARARAEIEAKEREKERKRREIDEAISRFEDELIRITGSRDKNQPTEGQANDE